MAIFDLSEPSLKPRKGVQASRHEKLTDDQRAKLKARHERALDGFKASASFFSQQRERELQDLKFVDFDEQWDPSVKTQRAGNQAVNGLPPTPPRPMLTINQLRAPCQQVANTRRAARIGLEFAPKGAGSSDDVAEVYEDIVRALQAESRASIARNWAADRSEKAGLGWYRLDTEYCQDPPSDPAAWNDQDLVWRRILNQASVYPDPHAQEPDFSDGRRWYVTEDLPLETYRELYPDSDLASYDAGELTGIGDAQPKWVFTSSNGADGDESQTVRIAEVWEVVEEERTLVALSDGTAAYEDDIPEGKTVAVGPMAKRRRKTTKRIYWSKINAVEYLEDPVETDWAYVPLIPTIGQESNVNGERRWNGIVRPGKDAAVSYNVMRSAQIESIASASKAPYIGFARVFGSFMEWWKQGPSRNFPFLPVDEAYDKQGNLLPLPQRNPAQIDIGAMTIASQAAKDDVHVTTGIPPVALGQIDPTNRSGKAIQALQGQSEVGSSGYMDNFVSITLAYEGKVVRSMLPKVFDRPGRIVAALGQDEKRRLVMLNWPYVDGPDGPVKLPNWQPGMPVPKEIPGPPNPQTGQPLPLEVKYYDLSAGEYSVMPVAGKSYPTRRQEAAAAIAEILPVLPPEMAAAVAPAFIGEQDWPAAKQISEILKKALPPQLAAAYDDQQPNPQVVQLQQQVQQLMQTLQSKVAEKQAEAQAKGQIDLQKTQLQEQGDNQRTAVEVQAGIQKAEIAAAASMANAQAKVDAENFRSYVDALETRLGHVLNLHMSKLEAMHTAIQGMHDRAHEVGMAAMAHQHALEQGQQAAALAPEPASPAESA